MNKKLVLIGAVLVIMTGLLYVGNSGIAGVNIINTSRSFKEIDELRNSANFPFNVPKALLDEKNLTFKNLNGQIIEIGNNTTHFKAAKFVNEGADAGGDYSEYKIDEQYNVSGATTIKHLRIRANSDTMDHMDKVVVNYDTGNIAYSLVIDKPCTYQDIVGLLGLTKGQLEKKDVKRMEEKVEKKVSEKIKKADDTDINQKSENTASGKDTNSSVYTIPSMGYVVKLPKTVLGIKTVEGSSEFEHITFFISGRPILAIEESNDMEYNKEISKSKSLKDGYTLKYYTVNPFKNGTTEFDSYEAIINSIDFIANSFEQLKTNETK